MSKTATDEIVMSYNLTTLPTASHKAGLAGMLLCIQDMIARKITPSPTFVVSECGMKATVRFTKESLYNLFKYFYGSGPFDKHVKEGKIEKVDAPLLKFLSKGGCQVSWQWMQLYHYFILTESRSNPQALAPFKKKTCGFSDKLWENLENFGTEPTPFHLLIGSESSNAEKVSMRETSRRSLLLHFWLVVSRVYSPSFIDFKSGRLTESIKGVVVVVPEIANLEFRDDFKSWIDTAIEVENTHFHPPDARISMPTEGGLAFMSQLLRDCNRLESVVHSVEYYFLNRKSGKNWGRTPKVAMAGVLDADERLVLQYAQIEQNYSNYTFQRGLIDALLNKEPWFTAVAKRMRDVKLDFLIPDYPEMSWFALCCFNKFRENRTMQEKQESNLPPFEAVVRWIMQTYIHAQAAKRSGRSGESETDPKDRVKIAQQLIMGLRDCRSLKELRVFWTPRFASTGICMTAGWNAYKILCPILMGRTYKEGEFEYNWESLRDASMLACGGECFVQKNDEQKSKTQKEPAASTTK